MLNLTMLNFIFWFPPDLFLRFHPDFVGVPPICCFNIVLFFALFVSHCFLVLGFSIRYFLFCFSLLFLICYLRSVFQLFVFLFFHLSFSCFLCFLLFIFCLCFFFSFVLSHVFICVFFYFHFFFLSVLCFWSLMFFCVFFLSIVFLCCLFLSCLCSFFLSCCFVFICLSVVFMLILNCPQPGHNTAKRTSFKKTKWKHTHTGGPW